MGATGMIQLRTYQRAAVDSIPAYFEANTGNPLICVPTGGGKTPIMTTFMREAIEAWPSTRIVLLSHVKELLDQSATTLWRMWPSAPMSVYSAGLRSKDLSGQIVIAGIQSIYRRAYDLQQVDLILIDECHLLGDSETGMYRRFLKDVAEINGRVPVIGFTATPWRETSGLLHRGPNALFTDIAFEIGMGELIEAGWLAPLRCKGTRTTLDVAGVHSRGGDYIASELQAAVDHDDINRAIVGELIEKGQDRRSWLLFGAGVDHARHLCDLIRAAGIEAACVFGETPAAERDAIVADFRAGRLRCLVNVAALLIGFDAPQVDLIGVARPTRSKGRYVQMLGRGTRLSPGKSDCLVLDWAGVVAQHGPVDLVRGKERQASEEGAPPMKVCPECDEQILAGLRRCPVCGHEFPAPDMAERLHDRAVESAVLSRELQDSDWLPVVEVHYRRHEKQGSPPSLRIDYRCGLNGYADWICLEHPGYAGEKAHRWWRSRFGQDPPATVEEALRRSSGLPCPSHIRIRQEGRYWRVIAYRHADAQAMAA